MGFSLKDLGESLNPFDKSNPVFGKGGVIDEGLRGLDDAFDFTGKSGAAAAEESAAIQQEAALESSALFDPFRTLGEQGLAQAGFLTDPQAQFDFLQSNPLFQLGLDNLNQQTQRTAAAQGRLSGTDTQQQLINNALLAASPLIGQQQQQIGNLLNLGLGVAGSQGNLLTSGAAAQAGGIIGAQNARTAGAQTGLDLLGQIGGALLAPTPAAPTAPTPSVLPTSAGG